MTDRPRPLRAAATAQSTTPTVLGGSASAVLLWAIVQRGQADLVALVLAGGIVVLQLVMPILAARRTAAAGEADVTPLDAPQDDDGTPLVRQDGALLVDVLQQMLDQLLAVGTAPPAPTQRRPHPRPTATTQMPLVAPPPRRDPASTRLPPPAPRDPDGRHALRGRP